MAWRRPGDKPLSEPMMVSLPTYICVARPQWVNRVATDQRTPCIVSHAIRGHDLDLCVINAPLAFPKTYPRSVPSQCRDVIMVNSLWPSDPLWRHGTGSTLAQLMACCLAAPSRYLNQCWAIINIVQWHLFEGNFTRDVSVINHWNELNFLSKSPRDQDVPCCHHVSSEVCKRRNHQHAFVP